MEQEELREGLTLADVARVLWRRKIAVVVTTAIVIGIAGAWVITQTPRYRSTSTLALAPATPENSLSLLGQINTILPLYAEAIQARETSQIAQAQLHTSRLAKVSVRTFRDAPIIKLDAESSDPRLAYQTAEATTGALIVRLKRGEVGISTIRLLQIDRPVVPESPIWPMVKLTLILGTLLGVGLGVAAALLIDQLKQRSKAQRPVRELESRRDLPDDDEPRAPRRPRSEPAPVPRRAFARLSELEQAAEQVMRLAETAPRRETSLDRPLRPQPVDDGFPLEFEDPAAREAVDGGSPGSPPGSVRRLLRPEP